MVDLTSEQISLIRIAIQDDMEKHGWSVDEYQEILDLLEYGCGVTVRTCAEDVMHTDQR